MNFHPVQSCFSDRVQNRNANHDMLKDPSLPQHATHTRKYCFSQLQPTLARKLSWTYKMLPTERQNTNTFISAIYSSIVCVLFCPGHLHYNHLSKVDYRSPETMFVVNFLS